MAKKKVIQKKPLGRIVLLPDNDEEGESGFKNLLWSLAERGLDGGWRSLAPGAEFRTWFEIGAGLIYA